MKRLLFPLLLLLSLTNTGAQANDTVYVKPSTLKPEVLVPGTHQWLIYFRNAPDSIRYFFQLWTRTITPIIYEGKKAIEVSQVWESKDTLLHTTRSISDAKDFRTLFHDSWWQQRGSSRYDFVKGTMEVNGVAVFKGDTSAVLGKTRAAFDSALQQYSLNWHLDLEVFPQLPLKKGITYMIPYYDPGFQQPKWVPYTVVGNAPLVGPNRQSTDCWLLEHQTPTNKEIFWISKNTKQVLKLEQKAGKLYRYKIKLM